MLILYEGPRESVRVGEFGPHPRGEIKDYPEEVGQELLETAVRNVFVCVEEPKEVYASAAARKLAGELGLDLDSITGTGHNGIITKADVERAAD